MAGILLLPPLLLLLVLIPGGAPSPTVTQDCLNAADKVPKEGESQVITTKAIKEYKSDIPVFVMPESGFEGFSLEVHGRNETQQSGWFPAEECFQQDGTWQQLLTWTTINSDDDNLSLGFETETCWRQCVVNKASQSLHSLSVVARGASRWIINTPPRKCNITYVASPSRSTSLPTCQDPPAAFEPDSSHSLSQKTTTPIVALTAVAVVWLCVGGGNL